MFFVAPRIEVDEDEDSIDPSFGAVDRARELADLVKPVKVVLVHGAMPPAERTAAMRAFRSGAAQLLVGTTVIEVGVDVPEATLMVIDGADRFGLAQLHQMRGRVGRGDRPGKCILMHDEPMTPIARERLQILADHADGATVARADLELRGAGDLGGTRQSGVEEELIYLDPDNPPKWLERIDHDTRAIEKEDPNLQLPANRALAHFVKSVERALVVRAEAG
ncbi:MAG: helicase-related protein [Polyangiaceae bacterium]